MMSSNGQQIGDGSWILRIYVTDLQIERSLRVKSDVHIGGVMLRLVDALDICIDWSDHALWWPEKNKWLSKTRFTLDQYCVQADARLHFTPMHKILKVQLPDLRYIDCKVDFSENTFRAVMHLCKELGIRHSEELSFCKPLEPCHLKSNFKDLITNRRNKELNGMHTPTDSNAFIINSNSSPLGSTGSIDKSPFMCAPVKSKQSTPISSPLSPHNTTKRSVTDNSFHSNGNTFELLYSSLDGGSLAVSPVVPSSEAKSKMLKPKTLVEKARMNVGWLDSSLSIMEQGIREFDTLWLRFKFYSFFDLNPKLDCVRINQIYEQAKWQILNDEVDCTEEEALLFAALQAQVSLQSNLPQPSLDSSSFSGDDDIDAALSELQVTLEGSHFNNSCSDITHVPELYDYLRFLKPKKFTLKAYKKYWFTFRELSMRIYKSKEDCKQNLPPLLTINLKGCEVTPDVSLIQSKYGIKLEVPSADGMNEMYIRCETEEQYAKWMAACRLASKGRSLADSTYEAEVASIKAFLQMQHPAPAPVINPSQLDIVPEDYVPSKYIKKLKGKLVHRVLEAHANVKELSLIEAKMNYIKAWQSLPDYGITLFVIKFMEQKKEELLGVSFNRLMKLELNTGYLRKTWRFSNVKAWNVNWEVKCMMVQFEDASILFECLSADCKVIHEFIGGYIFLSLRSKEANQSLNEDMFHKLTGGWD